MSTNKERRLLQTFMACPDFKTVAQSEERACHVTASIWHHTVNHKFAILARLSGVWSSFASPSRKMHNIKTVLGLLLRISISLDLKMYRIRGERRSPRTWNVAWQTRNFDESTGLGLMTTALHDHDWTRVFLWLLATHLVDFWLVWPT